MDERGWIDDFLSYMRADRMCSDRTIESYSRGLTAFQEFFASLDEGLTWSVVDADVVRRWMVDRMDAGVKPRSIQLGLSALRTFYRYLLLMQRVDYNPMTRVVAPRADKPLPKFFRDEDVNRLLDRLRGLATGESDEADAGDLTAIAGKGRYRMARAYLLVSMLYMTGARIAEVSGMDVADIETAARQVKVTGKRSKQRIIPIAPALEEAIRIYLPLREQEQTRRSAQGAVATESASGAVFLDARGRRATEQSLSKLAARLTSTVTTQKQRSAHVFRHTFATSMLNAGSDLQSVKELLGHASLSTTEVYTHTNFEEMRQAYNHAHPRG